MATESAFGASPIPGSSSTSSGQPLQNSSEPSGRPEPPPVAFGTASAQAPALAPSSSSNAPALVGSSAEDGSSAGQRPTKQEAESAEFVTPGNLTEQPPAHTPAHLPELVQLLPLAEAKQPGWFSSQLQAPMSRWRVPDVAEFFCKHELPGLSAHIHQEAIDGRMLAEMTRSDLVNLGVPWSFLDDLRTGIQNSLGKVRWAEQLEEVWQGNNAGQHDLPAFGGNADDLEEVPLGSERDDGARDKVEVEVGESEAEEIEFRRRVRQVVRLGKANIHSRRCPS